MKKFCRYVAASGCESKPHDEGKSILALYDRGTFQRKLSDLIRSDGRGRRGEKRGGGDWAKRMERDMTEEAKKILFYYNYLNIIFEKKNNMNKQHLMNSA